MFALALAADSAIERYRERVAAQNALVAVRRDLGADIEQVGAYIARSRAGYDARLRRSAFVADGSEIQDSIRFVEDQGLQVAYLTFDASTAASEALKNSGRLDLIAEGDLREGLLDLNRRRRAWASRQLDGSAMRESGAYVSCFS